MDNAIRRKPACIYRHKLKRVGLSRSNRTVYYLEGKGYWICPPYISVYSSVGVGKMVGVAFTPFKGEHVVRYANGTLQDIVAQIAEAVRDCANAGYLFDVGIDRRFLQLPYTLVRSKTYNLKPPACVCAMIGKPNKNIQMVATKDESAMAFLERCRRYKASLIEQFRKAHTITVAEALTFHPINPLLYELEDESSHTENIRTVSADPTRNAYREAKLGL